MPADSSPFVLELRGLSTAYFHGVLECFCESLRIRYIVDDEPTLISLRTAFGFVIRSCELRVGPYRVIADRAGVVGCRKDYNCTVASKLVGFCRFRVGAIHPRVM